MKKLTILMLCIATLGLASCKKDTIINQTTPNRTIIFDKPANSWVQTTNGFYVDLDANEIDFINVQDEGVLVYISTDGVTATGYYQIPNAAANYDYDIYEKKIRVYYYNNVRPTTTTRIKIVLVAAENIS